MTGAELAEAGLLAARQHGGAAVAATSRLGMKHQLIGGLLASARVAADRCPERVNGYQRPSGPWRICTPLNVSATVCGRPAESAGLLLDHQYTSRGLKWSRLKGADASRVSLLRHAANRAGCEAILALADIKTTHSAFEDDYDDCARSASRT